MSNNREGSPVRFSDRLAKLTSTISSYLIVGGIYILMFTVLLLGILFGGLLVGIVDFSFPFQVIMGVLLIVSFSSILVGFVFGFASSLTS